MTEPLVIYWEYHMQLFPEYTIYSYVTTPNKRYFLTSGAQSSPISLILRQAPTLSQAIRAVFEHRLLYTGDAHFELSLQCAHVWERAL